MVQIEGDRMDAALQRYAQERASTWGAERFATEFKRRELEERWLEAARSHTSPYSPATATDRTLDVLAGPVDAAVEDVVVGSDRAGLRLLRPAHERHASVPRPPAAEPERARRTRRRERARAESEAAWTIPPAEAARMSAAGRRLYGLDDPV